MILLGGIPPILSLLMMPNLCLHIWSRSALVTDNHVKLRASRLGPVVFGLSMQGIVRPKEAFKLIRGSYGDATKFLRSPCTNNITADRVEMHELMHNAWLPAFSCSPPFPSRHGLLFKLNTNKILLNIKVHPFLLLMQWLYAKLH